MKKIVFPIFILLIIMLSVVEAYAQTYNMSNAGTISTCSGTFYDSGGPSGQYNNNETFQMTFCSNMLGSQLSLSFTSFNSEQCCDHIKIYDGPNTSGNLLAQAEGANPAIIVGQILTSNNGSPTQYGCLTVTWTSDGSVINSGWVALISCTFPCQVFNININNPSTPFFSGDTIHICQNTPLTLHVTGTYGPQTNYSQSDATTQFHWTYGDGSAPGFADGVGLTTVTHTWPEGAYYVTVTGTDINGCVNSNLARIMILVSITPTFIGTNITPDTICPGEQITLDGLHLQTHPWTTIVDTMVAGLTYLPDGQGVPYETTITNSLFIPGQTMTSVSDLVSVCLNIEHSYLGDLTIWLICPSGQYLNILTYPDGFGSTWFGIPIDDDTNTAPGVGWTYCWTPTATTPITAMYSTSLPAGDYQPTGPFSDLLGCVMNGNWTIHVEDHLGSDNGYIFWWALHFNPAIIPPQFSFTNTYPDSSLFNWTGPNIISQNNGLGAAAPTTTGTNTYTFQVIDDYNCQYDTSLTMWVRPLSDPLCCDMPATSAGSSDSLCSNTYTLNATLTPGNTGTWTVAPGAPGTATIANLNSQNSQVTVNQWGTYYFVWAETFNGQATCVNRDTVAITFSQIPNSAFTVTSIPCFGDSTTVAYTGTAGTGAAYVWDFGGVNNWISQSGNGQGPYAGTWAVANTYNITLYVVENGCTSPTTTIPVLLPAQLSHTNQVVHNPCNGDQLGSITINTTGGTLPYTYNWASGTNVMTALAAGQYNVTVSDDNGCNFSESFTITEPTVLIPDTSFHDISCYGGSDGWARIQVTGGTGVYTYTWDPPLSNSELQTNLSANTYFVTVTDANGCQITETFILGQPLQLTLTVTDDVAICFGVNTTMQATAGGGVTPYTYLWNGSPNTMTLTVSPTVTSTYVVQIQDAHGCFSSIGDITITVSPHMTQSMQTENNSCYNSCDGSSNYIVTGGITPLIYSWPSPTGLLTGLCAGLYSVTATDQIGCSIDTSFTITQPPPLTASATSSPATCYGYNDGSASVTANGGTTPYWYFWSSGSNMANATNLFAGAYTITVTDLNGCSVIRHVTVTEPARVYVTSSDDQTICIGGAVNISAQVMGGVPPYSYYWEGDTIYTGPVIHTDPLTTTTYNLTVTDKNGCKGNTQTVIVFVYPPLQMTMYTIDDTVCPGEPASIRAIISGGNGGPYMIYLNNGTVVSPPFDVFPTETQTYVLSVYDRCETPGIEDSVHITVMPVPLVNPQVSKYEGCVPLTLNFIESSPDDGQVYTWRFGDGVNSEGSSAKNPVHTFNYHGTYYVTLTVTSSFGCSKTITMDNPIIVYPLPEARFYTIPKVVSVVDPRVDFVNLSVADTVFWAFGDGDSSLIGNPTHYFSKPGTYEVTLIAKTLHGCTDTLKQNITVKEEFTMYAPTAFSPNNDGRNDEFGIMGEGIHPEEFSLIVYNRWGEKVFETKDKNAKWNGKYKGKTVESGVYTWAVIYKDTNGIGHQISGNVTVIR